MRRECNGVKRKRKLLIKLTVTTIFILVNIIIRVGIKNIKFSHKQAMESLLNPKAKVVFQYDDGKVTSLITEEDSKAKLHSIQKRFGIWLIDYPYIKSDRGIITLKNDLYYYNLYENEKAESILLKGEKGEVIHPIKEEKIYIKDKNYLAYVFKVENYTKYMGNLQIMALDKDGNTINVKSNEFDDMKISLSLITNVGNKLYTYNEEEIKSFKGDKEKLIETFIETINSKTEIEPMVFEGSKMPDIQKDISTSTIFGEYIKIEGKDKVFTWNHNVGYHIMLHGEYKNTLIKSDNSYFNHSLFKDGPSGKSLYYKVASSDKLNKIFDLYFQ